MSESERERERERRKESERERERHREKDEVKSCERMKLEKGKRGAMAIRRR